MSSAELFIEIEIMHLAQIVIFNNSTGEPR